MRSLLRNLAWVAIVGLLATANAVVHGDPNCYKRCGFGDEVARGTVSGRCAGEGGVCFWVDCALTTPQCIETYGEQYGFQNNDCFSYVDCRPLIPPE